MSVGLWKDPGGGDNSQDFTPATQEEATFELDEYTQVEPVADADGQGTEESARAAEPVPWGRLMRLAGGAAIPLMPRPEQMQGRAMNEVTLGRSKACEVQIVDRRISSKHCRIYCEAVSGHLGGFEVYVEDMSANGTWINQSTKLKRGARRLLNSGDEIALLNPRKAPKKASDAVSGTEGGGESGKEASEDGERTLEAEDATYTFINLDRNRGMSHGRAESLSVAETMRAGTVPGVSSPVLRSSASGVSGMFGGARKVEDFYDVREMIGHGTSGEVRRAINRASGKQVAVKVIETRKFALTPGLTPKELVQEAEMLKRVDHEYIIKLEDIFQTEQAVYLVMDLVSGGDLFDRIVEKGLYAEDLAQELLFRVLTAVEYLHSQDIVHRDLKPENILLVGRDNDVDVKITDFGLAKRANKEGLKTFCGTPQYFAPEVLKRRNTVLGVGRYGKEADMWSVGVILYILLSGTHPFHTTTLFDQITHASYSMAGPEWEHISAKAKDLVSKLLTESPKARLTADQALAHPFITMRAGAAQPSVVTLSAGASDAQGSNVSATALAKSGVAGMTDSNGTGGANGVESRGAAVGRTCSQDTDVSTTSADEAALTTSKSLSPAEGGGGSAKAAPGGSAVFSLEDGLPSRLAAQDLPPPQPREPTRAGGLDRGTRGEGGAGRKRGKKDGGGDKPPNPYSQLQMQLVSIGTSEEGAGEVSIQSSGASAKGVSRDSGGFHSMSAPPAPAAADGSNRRAAAGLSGKQGNVAKPRARAKPGQASQDTSGQIRSPEESTTRSGVRGKRKSANVHSTQSPTATAAAAIIGRPSTRRTGANVRVEGSAADLTADDIMEYSSDDSPAKAKRTRISGRGQGPRGGAAAKGPAVGAPSSSALMQNQRECRNGGGNGGQQMLLNVGDGGKLNLSKLGPLSRPGVGSAGGAGAVAERPNGDHVAQAAAGGAAATTEESLGGGAPAGVGHRNGETSASSDAGKAGRSSKQAKGSKPQRTMTHLWKKRTSEREA